MKKNIGRIVSWALVGLLAILALWAILEFGGRAIDWVASTNGGQKIAGAWNATFGSGSSSSPAAPAVTPTPTAPAAAPTVAPTAPAPMSGGAVTLAQESVARQRAAEREAERAKLAGLESAARLKLEQEQTAALLGTPIAGHFVTVTVNDVETGTTYDGQSTVYVEMFGRVQEFNLQPGMSTGEVPTAPGVAVKAWLKPLGDGRKTTVVRKVTSEDGYTQMDLWVYPSDEPASAGRRTFY